MGAFGSISPSVSTSHELFAVKNIDIVVPIISERPKKGKNAVLEPKLNLHFLWLQFFFKANGCFQSVQQFLIFDVHKSSSQHHQMWVEMKFWSPGSIQIYQIFTFVCLTDILGSLLKF